MRAILVAGSILERASGVCEWPFTILHVRSRYSTPLKGETVQRVEIVPCKKQEPKRSNNQGPVPNNFLPESELRVYIGV